MDGRGRGGGGFNRREDLKRLKESVAGTKTGLPPKLIGFFAPRDPLQAGTALSKKPPALPYTGVAQYTDLFAAPGDEEYEPEPPTARPPSPRLFKNRELEIQIRLDTETRTEKRNRVSKWLVEEAERVCKEKAKYWDPNKDPRIEGDPFKTLFVGRLSYDVNDKKLRKEFEEYGPIKNVRVVQVKATGKPRGYAFIEFEHKKDMKDAYKLADGKKVEGRRIVVDVERGRTVDNWKPRRLGGGLGGEGRLPKEPKKKGMPASHGGTAMDDGRRDFRMDRGMRDRSPARGRSPMRDRPRSPIRDRKRERSPSPRRGGVGGDTRRFADQGRPDRRRERDML